MISPIIEMTVIVLHKIEKASTHCWFHPSAPNHRVNIIFVKPLTAICREQSIVKHWKLWDRLPFTSLIASKLLKSTKQVGLLQYFEIYTYVFRSTYSTSSCNVVFYTHPYSLIINIKQLYSFWWITQFADTNNSVLSLELLNSFSQITQFYFAKKQRIDGYHIVLDIFFSILDSSYMNVLHLHCGLSSCPSPSLICPKVATPNLCQQPRDKCSNLSKLRTNKTVKFENHLRQRPPRPKDR